MSHATCPASWALNNRSTPGSPENGGVNDSYALLSLVALKRPRPLYPKTISHGSFDSVLPMYGRLPAGISDTITTHHSDAATLTTPATTRCPSRRAHDCRMTRYAAASAGQTAHASSM